MARGRGKVLVSLPLPRPRQLSGSNQRLRTQTRTQTFTLPQKDLSVSTSAPGESAPAPTTRRLRASPLQLKSNDPGDFFLAPENGCLRPKSHSCQLPPGQVIGGIRKVPGNWSKAAHQVSPEVQERHSGQPGDVFLSPGSQAPVCSPKHRLHRPVLPSQAANG